MPFQPSNAIPISVDSSLRQRSLVAWMAATNLMLMAATWRLWWPTPGVEFPAVLWTDFIDVDWLSSTAVMASSFGGTIACLLGLFVLVGVPIVPLRFLKVRSRSVGIRLASGLVLLGGLLLVVLNQHRFQPWFYQLLVFCSLWIVGGKRLFEPKSLVSAHAFAYVQAVVISVYFYSSLGKLDYQFLHTVGQQFLGAIFALSGLDIVAVSWEWRLLLAALLPLGELLLAVCLLYCWLRRTPALAWCGWGAIVFHLSLVFILGYQLQHSLGVVLWNVQFAGLAIILFVMRDACHKSDSDCSNLEPERATASATLCTAAISLAVILLPLGERWGYWDHWPSWALYAPHSSRVEVMIAPQAVDRLPASLRALVGDEVNTDEMGWLRLPLARWSLEETAAPIYPQSRFQLRVTQQLAARINSPFQVQAIVLGQADRFSGKRTERLLRGSQEIMQSGP